jgi:hypothetical protein
LLAVIATAAHLAQEHFNSTLRRELTWWVENARDDRLKFAAHAALEIHLTFAEISKLPLPARVKASAIRAAAKVQDPILVGVRSAGRATVLHPQERSGGTIEKNLGILYAPTDVGAVTAFQYLGEVSEEAAVSTLKQVADETVAEAIRRNLNAVAELLAAVIIGEGRIDEVRTLGIGEKVGAAHFGFYRHAINALRAAIGVDPVEITEGVRKFLISGSTSVLIVAEEGALLEREEEVRLWGIYAVAGAKVHHSKSLAEKVQAMSDAKGRGVGKLNIASLYRDYQKDAFREMIAAGVRAA